MLALVYSRKGFFPTMNQEKKNNGTGCFEAQRKERDEEKEINFSHLVH